MSVLLQWTPRCNADEQRVYRDTSPLDQSSLPSPLATLATDDRDYTDSTASANTAYWYGVGAVATGPSPDAVLITQVKITTGAAPTDILDQSGDAITDQSGDAILDQG